MWNTGDYAIWYFVWRLDFDAEVCIWSVLCVKEYWSDGVMGWWKSAKSDPYWTVEESIYTPF